MYVRTGVLSAFSSTCIPSKIIGREGVFSEPQVPHMKGKWFSQFVIKVSVQVCDKGVDASSTMGVGTNLIDT